MGNGMMILVNIKGKIMVIILAHKNWWLKKSLRMSWNANVNVHYFPPFLLTKIIILLPTFWWLKSSFHYFPP